MVSNPDRASYFPAIEKKHGLPMTFWHDQMKLIKDLKYPEQIAYLRENHGFSQAHANALVLYSKGNTTSKRFSTLEEFLVTHDATKQKTIKVPVDWKVDTKLLVDMATASIKATKK
jgi:hypothetical protein